MATIQPLFPRPFPSSRSVLSAAPELISAIQLGYTCARTAHK
jgi:hypothetical protein